MKAVVKDLANMHKQLQPLLTRAQLHAVFHQILSAFDGGLLEAYSAVDTGPLFSRLQSCTSTCQTAAAHSW